MFSWSATGSLQNIMGCHLLLACLGFLGVAKGLKYDPEHVGWNLNENQAAINPLDYSGEWTNHTFNPSPENWRFPFYILTLDRYVDGDPTNNEANGTMFEHDWMSNQFRFGGDARGLMNHLDYIQGFGMKGLYLSGSPFINQPWASDGFGPLDFTLLDHHHGQIADWRALINEIHRRGMYVILDNTMATMGDLLAFVGYENATTPFTFDEYNVIYKTDRVYHDFQFGSEVNETCQYPRIWGENGFPLSQTILDMMKGCKISEFDQYGDMIGVGSVPPAQSQLAKFASVQDRLRAWRPDVLAKLKHFSCMEISMLDIDGFRMDKAFQTTIDASAEWSNYMRQCARSYGKENFLIVGEAVGEMPFGSISFGRGTQPDMKFDNLTEAQLATNETNSTYIREWGYGALDGEAFHYPTYGGLTRFLGLDGVIGLDGVDFVNMWNTLLSTNDMVNSNTGKFDPRHMFGTTNQDVFRWPSLANGTQRQNLGFFVTVLEMPGIPMLLWGEEQQYRALENIAGNYIFGRGPMASSQAWQAHGCYKVGAEGNGYYDLPLTEAANACGDDSISLDHRDPSHPLRNILKRMYEIRQQYPALNDGYKLQTLSTQLYDIYLPGSDGMPSPTGLWSVYRGRTEGVQDLIGGQGNQGAWLLFSNDNATREYECDCKGNQSRAILAPFPVGATVKNLFYPHEEYTLENSTSQLGIESSTEFNGCLSNITLDAWGYKALVPKSNFVEPGPTITGLYPGHDSRLSSTVPLGEQQTVQFEIQFNREMDCQSIVKGMTLQSDTQDGITMALNDSSVACSTINPILTNLVGEPGSTFSFRASLVNVSHGVHSVILNNVTTAAQDSSTIAIDRYMFRLGASDNPIVFPGSANYTEGLLRQDGNGSLIFHPTAAGAGKWRYSTNWGSSYSDWLDYTGEDSLITPQAWSGTDLQSWVGQHIVTQYWSDMTGSSDHVQHSDLGDTPPRRWPHAHMQGPWNQYGYDGGLNDSMTLGSDGWSFSVMDEYPSYYIVNIWGMNPDGAPDKSAAYGDVDGDNVLDNLPPDTLAKNTVNVTQPPGMPYTGYRMLINDGSYRYTLEPTGSAWDQLAIFVLLGLFPLMGACLAVVIFMKSFYQVKFNKVGLLEDTTLFAEILGKFRKQKSAPAPASTADEENDIQVIDSVPPPTYPRRTVAVATMEYIIPDWNIKVKIGGLGVMAKVMSTALPHQNLVWVVPCVGDIEYPTDQPDEPIFVKTLNGTHQVSVQLHKWENITFVLLDAPIFREQTSAVPYPARMDDMPSAAYYSAWNQCIGEVIRRNPEIDLYHINDYHGTLAPLYLLPRVIPCCLSLHNAEFQGLWSINSEKALLELCEAFNLKESVVRGYVQFGSTFNLLHAGASYLRKHQNGRGAIGVSHKYGERAHSRYGIFWGLSKIGGLPNPDPEDLATWDKKRPHVRDIKIDRNYEARRAGKLLQTQEWAHLEPNKDALLFYFVGRWSKQKGVDLIADIFPSILASNKKVQLLCIGPVIDLYGKLTAIKLEALMKQYPGRVVSMPKFTQVPSFVNEGIEFALIPSRDEPFGLVSLEAGRKGGLGVGARVGGLGQMPGWWFTIESIATQHLTSQFKIAIKMALASTPEQRALMRARSAPQRFPAAQWVEDLEKLEVNSIRYSMKVQDKRSKASRLGFGLRKNGITTEPSSIPNTALNSGYTTRLTSPTESRAASRGPSRPGSRESSPTRDASTGAQLLHKRLSWIKKNRSDKLNSLTSSGDLNPQDARNNLYTIPSSTDRRDNDSRSSEECDGDMIAPITPGFPSSSRMDYSDTYASAAPSGATTPTYPPQARVSWNDHLPSLLSSPGSSGISTPVPYSRDVFPTMQNHASVLSLQSVTGDLKNLELQNVDASFTDSNGLYADKYAEMLQELTAKNSEGKLSIEKYLMDSEKEWFRRYADAKLGRSGAATPASSVRKQPVVGERRVSDNTEESSDSSHHERSIGSISDEKDEFNLGEDYKPPTGMRKLLMYKIGDWPIYSFLLAFGQIIAANSYQITLLTGENGQSANMLYSIASIYLVSSIGWWFLSRFVKSIYVLSLPFLFYGAAFFLLGMTPYGPSVYGRGWIQNVATGLYAIGSASGGMFFALNFGSEGGTPTETWVFRACMIQGTQQIYVALLWFWGAYNTDLATSGVQTSEFLTSTPLVTAIGTPIAVLLWGVGVVLLMGLPEYYRQTPGTVPAFYRSLSRRKIVMWFFVVVILQNYWLSAPYGRNWRYLWSSTVCPQWAIAVLLIVFFIPIWGGSLGIIGHFSKEHSWLLPLFAMGLGAPRWCQMLWGTSGMGSYLPWVGSSQVLGILVARGLWLWLGLLDSLQGIGFGMILLQTLTRLHITFTLMAGQILGSAATIAARATAPDNVGPGPVFPNLALSTSGLGSPYFWVALAFQMIVPIGFFVFFRREQLFKP